MSLLPKRTGSYSPFDLFDDRFNNLWEGFFRPAQAEGGVRQMVPRVDISEQETMFEIKADMPGMKKEDIELTLDDGVLTISATKEDEHKEEKTGQLIHRERSYGRYVRQIPVGSNIDEQHVHASFEDGVLNIRVPKREPEARDKIKVAIR